jgi:hypothetical protein
VSRLDDPELVRAEYADESRFSVRAAAQHSSTGPDPRQLAFDAVAEVAPACHVPDLEPFDGPRVCSRLVAVFVAETVS